MGQNMGQNMGQAMRGQNMGQALGRQNVGQVQVGLNMGQNMGQNMVQNMGQALMGQNMGQTNVSGDIRLQRNRWMKFINQWISCDQRCEIMVVGDTNLDFLKWGTPEQAHEHMVTDTKDNIETLGYMQIVEGATRFWKDTSPSLIDQVWCNNVQNIVHCKNMVRAVADHNIVETVVRLKGRIEIKLESRQRKWKELDVKKFKTHLEAKNWDEIIEMKDPDLAYNAIEENLKEALEKFIPIKKVQRKKDQKSWITTETRKMMEDRDRARAKAAESNEDDDWKSYRKMRNKVVEKVRKDKKEHFKELFDKAEEKNYVKNTFRIAKEQLGWNTGGPPTALVKGGKLFSKPVEVAEEMSRHFDEKIRTLELNRPKSDEDPLAKTKEGNGKLDKGRTKKSI